MEKFSGDGQRPITIELLKEKPLPKHIAIIMDGNGRWAKKRGLPRTIGHRYGVESLKKIIESFVDLGIGYLTVYAFSTENWKRPEDEVDALMDLVVEFIDKELDYLNSKGIKVNPIGYIERITGLTYEKIMTAKERTKDNTVLTLNVALNYGGRQEIVRSVKAICQNVLSGETTIDEIDEEFFANTLYTGGQPDPDLLIRPSGEMRVSNFLLWQIAYSEFWITNILWPDFKQEHLWQAIYDYQNRQRRFGGLKS